MAFAEVHNRASRAVMERLGMRPARARMRLSRCIGAEPEPVGYSAVPPARPGHHTGAVTYQPPWPQQPPPPPRKGFWQRLSPIQRVGLIAAAVLLPCCGGGVALGALAGDPKPVVTDVPVAEQVAGTTTTEPAVPPTTEPATAAPLLATTTAAATKAATTTRTVKVTKPIAYPTRRVDDDSLAKGKTKVRTKGVNGTRTQTYTVTLTGGRETSRRLVSDVVTKKPVTKVIAVGTKESSSGGGNCDPNYTPCVPIASDVDCAGGSGNGPAYVDGPVTVIGDDIYKLDNDGDGTGCES